jgi:activator of 2-hydroxyglutaryl-CoA dehydratase
MFKNIKLIIIRHKGNIWATYVGNKKLDDSKSKKDALKRIFEEIDMQAGCSMEKLKGEGIDGQRNCSYHQTGWHMRNTD